MLLQFKTGLGVRSCYSCWTFTRRTFSPRMKSWLTWRVHTLPYSTFGLGSFCLCSELVSSLCSAAGFFLWPLLAMCLVAQWGSLLGTAGFEVSAFPESFSPVTCCWLSCTCNFWKSCKQNCSLTMWLSKTDQLSRSKGSLQVNGAFQPNTRVWCCQSHYAVYCTIS